MEGKLAPEAQGTNRKIPALWAGLIVWCLIFFTSARFLIMLPASVFVVLALVNFAVIGVLVLALRNAYRDRDPSNSARSIEPADRKISALWGLLIIWSLTLLNVIRLIRVIPIAAFILGVLINGGLVGACIVALHKA